MGQRPDQVAAGVRKHGVEAFEELAADAPEAMDALASHVEKADPATARKLRSKKAEALEGLEQQRKLLAEEGSGEDGGKPAVDAARKAEADLEALKKSEAAKPGDEAKTSFAGFC